MKVIHLSTHILTEFGILDDAGNVLPDRKRIVTDNGQPLVVPTFAREAFSEAFDKISEARERLTASLVLPVTSEQQPPPDPEK